MTPLVSVADAANAILMGLLAVGRTQLAVALGSRRTENVHHVHLGNAGAKPHGTEKINQRLIVRTDL